MKANITLRIAELFATTVDVHMVLGNITEEDYSCDTMDGAGKSLEDCMRRISRILCGDMEILTPEDVVVMADYVYFEQVKKISEALLEVSNRNDISTVVTTGLGMDIIGAKASEMAGLKWVGMDKLIDKKDCIVAPAIGTAILMEQNLRENI